jgi:hypothetical protein
MEFAGNKHSLQSKISLYVTLLYVDYKSITEQLIKRQFCFLLLEV